MKDQRAADAKKELRKAFRVRRDELSASEKEAMDSVLCGQLYETSQAHDARIIHTYLPMGSEIGFTSVIQKWLDEGRTVICPLAKPGRILENRVLRSLSELEKGVMGTVHPAAPDVYSGRIDLIVVPGLAFNRNKYRLGYGGGYYDTFLSQQKDAWKAGLFYSFQKAEDLPVEPHDLPMDEVITVDRALRVTRIL